MIDFFAVHAYTSGMPLTKGSSAPDWQAIDQDGKSHTLMNYRGKWVLLYFYPKDDTPGCTTEACGFRDAFSDLASQVTILGVSADSQESHQKFANKYTLPFALLADADRVIITAYGATADQLGKRVSFLIDPSGTIDKIYTGIDCAKHAAQILSDRKALQ